MRILRSWLDRRRERESLVQVDMTSTAHAVDLMPSETEAQFAVSDYEIPPSMAPQLLAHATTELERFFYRGQDRLVHKWTHYLAIYEKHFSRFRQSSLTMLEIGVSRGGSLSMWREYFGPAATIVGIDIDEACADVVTPPTAVRIGSQDDPAFLKRVIDEFGPFDLVLDDGSHLGRHQMASFRVLFPELNPDGMYVIEDLHTSYWPHYEGGIRRPGTGVEFVKQLIDDMHSWYHVDAPATEARDWVSGLHIYDSIVVIDKGLRSPPRHIQVPPARE